MKKKLSLIIASFVIISVAVYVVVGLVFFWGNQNPVNALDDSTALEGFYRVIFDTKGGSPIDPVNVPAGQKVTRPENPTFGYSDFVGWYEDAECQIVFDFEQPIRKNYTIYAKWDTKEFTVTFDTCGGEAIESKIVVKGDKISPVTPVWSGYQFEGWYTDENYEHAYDFKQPVLGDLTLYAKWPIELVLTADESAYYVEGYHGTDSEIEIPAFYKGKPVEYVGDWAFENKTSLTKVTIADGVQSIGICAFYGCTNLTTVELPDSLTVGLYAFYHCPYQVA